MTLAARGVQLGRDGNGIQWQMYEEQAISLCFSKIVVPDADCEVKMKDALWYFFFFFLKYIYIYGGGRSEREGGAFGWWLWANRRLTLQHCLQVKEVEWK